jgi:outer membrane protein assembly factor BamB
VAPHGDPPTEWSETRNVRWKVAVPGRGHATPIVWGDRVYVLTAIKSGGEAPAPATSEPPKPPPPPSAPTEPPAPPPGASKAPLQTGLFSSATASLQDPPPGGERPQGEGRGDRPPRGEGQRRGDGPPDGERPPRGEGRRGPRGEAPTDKYSFVVLALDRATGKTLWQQTAREVVPHEGHHPDATFASASPVTDGQVLIAHFGSTGVFAYDLAGKLLWEKDLGDMQVRRGFGEGSSPALHGDTVVINWDHEGDSFIIALDKRTGAERWKKERDEDTTWSTPLVVEVAGRPQVVVNASNRVRAYDLASGDVVWECGGQTPNAIPSPVFGQGLLIAMSGFRGNAIRAIRIAEAKGDVTDGPAVAWSYNEDTPYVPSPLLYGPDLYFLKHTNGILSCFEAATGEPRYAKQRLEGIENVYASPVGAAGRVYIAGREGATLVLKQGPALEVLARNTLEDGFDASPAIAGRDLFLRGRQALYCLAVQ